MKYLICQLYLTYHTQPIYQRYHTYLILYTCFLVRRFVDKQAFAEIDKTTQQQNLEPCFLSRDLQTSRTPGRVGVPWC